MKQLSFGFLRSTSMPKPRAGRLGALIVYENSFPSEDICSLAPDVPNHSQGEGRAPRTLTLLATAPRGEGLSALD